MIQLIAFKALFCLGAANELGTVNLDPPIHISKHIGGRVPAVKNGKWYGRRFK